MGEVDVFMRDADAFTKAAVILWMLTMVAVVVVSIVVQCLSRLR